MRKLFEILQLISGGVLAIIAITGAVGIMWVAIQMIADFVKFLSWF